VIHQIDEGHEPHVLHTNGGIENCAFEGTPEIKISPRKLQKKANTIPAPRPSTAFLSYRNSRNTNAVAELSVFSGNQGIWLFSFDRKIP